MSPESEPPLVAYTLQIISANDLPLRRLKVLGERNVIVKATVEGRSETTNVCTCTSSAEWNETFQIEARKSSSVLLLRLYGSTHGTSLNCVSNITISDLLQLCRNGEDAEVDLHEKKSGRKVNGRIKIHLSLTGSGDWIHDEAQRWALVLSQPDTALTAAGGYIDDVDGLLAKASASESISNVLDKLSYFMGIANDLAKIHPYAKGAWDILSAVHKIIVAQVAIDQSIADLLKTIQDVYGFVDAIKKEPSKIKHPVLEDIIERILNQTAECGRFIQEYLGHGFAGRLLRETMGASTAVTVAGMAQSLISLRGKFDTGLSVQIAIVCFRIQTDVNTILMNQTLDKLGSSGVPLARRSLCLPNTRRDVIDEILAWALHPSKGDNSNVFFLHGVAGIGKSAVAATIATHLSKMDRLGAFVSFDRAPPGQSQPPTAVKALALQMAVFDERLMALIVDIINDRTKAPVLDALLPEQFERLIVKPLASIPALPSDGAIIIVLDGLYECGQPGDWPSVLDLLVRQTESLPSNVRFLVTSRTVNGVQKPLTSTALHPHTKSRELRSSSQADISAYFTFRMEQIRSKNEHLQKDWPGQAAIVEITARAFGYYPWAVSASNFLDMHNPQHRLQSLLLQPLKSIPDLNTRLDELYSAALNSAGNWTDDDFVEDFRTIIGAILGSPIAISATAIHRELNRPMSSPSVMAVIRGLGSVMSHEPVVQVLHPSFLDFLSSRERCGHDINCYFDLGPARPEVSAGPATLCLQRMNTGLKRNICDMTISARLTTKVLPEELAYACQFWIDYIFSDETFELREMEQLMGIFLHAHLLHWFEAMSILMKSEEVVPTLQRAATWLEKNTFEDNSLKDLVIEAIDFSRKLASVIAEHPLNIYHVLLPSCSAHSILYQRFHDALVDPSVLLVPLHGVMGISAETTTMCLLTMNAGLKRNMGNMTLSLRLTTEVLPEVLAYACQSWVDHICTDGTVGSRAMEKLVIFLRTHLLHWFEAMSLLKKSEDIAPMLQRVATWLEENILEDKSLKDLVIEAIDFARKFAAEIAEHPLYVYHTALPLLPSQSILRQLFHDAFIDPSVMRLSPPNGHVNSMAFSTDALQLVTIYTSLTIWDTGTGDKLLSIETPGIQPYSVAFSYDGSLIACGTTKSTVYVWDSVSGAQVISPLSHSGSSKYVNAVAWSTDGERLLSGCWTGEMNLWNVTSPKGSQPITKIHHPGCSKGQPLRWVALSSDGSQIASCSDQGDVSVWDSKTGGIVWSVQDPQCFDPLVSLSFLSSDIGPFLVAQTKEGTQTRDASTGDDRPLPASLAGAVGLTCGDFMVNFLTESILKHYSTSYAYGRWAAQGQYFAFGDDGGQCHVVHLPKKLLL